MAETTATPAPARRPDAVLCPKQFQLKVGTDSHANHKKLFARTLGSARVYTREMITMGDQVLITPSHDIFKYSYYFPHGHPWQGQDRYDWYHAMPKGDGTWIPGAEVSGLDGEDRIAKLGYLKADPYASDPATQEQIQAAIQAKFEEVRKTPEYWQQLKDRGIIDADQLAEMLQSLGIDVHGTKEPASASNPPQEQTKPSPAQPAASPAQPQPTHGANDV